jgi:spectinomycin phosphotransferase
VAVVETPAPGGIDERDLVDALRATWALDVDELTYVPKGAGSYHWLGVVGGRPRCFLTVDDLDAKPWIGTTRESVFEGLSVAFQAAWLLNHEVGLPFVVGPLPSVGGSTVARLSDQFSVAAFPFVDGRAGSWGEPISGRERDELLVALAQLHTATCGDLHISRSALDLPERLFLTRALDSLSLPWDGGPLSEPAQSAWAAHARAVRGWMEQLDALGARLGEMEGVEVVTHGEPHPGNLIHAAGGLRLIDWDTLALARPERDLWMLDDGSPAAFAPYQELTGARISQAAISFYRLAWTLSDIASYVGLFRSPHRDDKWVRRSWAAFQQLLDGTPAAPYGVGRR